MGEAAPTNQQNKSLRVAVVQIECHPELVSDEHDYSAEPFMRDDGYPLMAALSAHQFNVEDIKSRCRRDYLAWHTDRLTGVLEWFKLKFTAQNPMPHLIVFPEGSIPRELLPLIRDFAIDNGVAIIAGTHVLHHSNEAAKAYWDVKPQKQLKEEEAGWFDRWSASGLSSLSVVTYIDHLGHITLRRKSRLSPFEIGATGLASLDEEIASMDMKFRGGLHAKVLCLVCSEALQWPHDTTGIELLVIPSYNADSQFFGPIKAMATMNQIPVVYCNDGRFGGSVISMRYDVRNSLYWNLSKDESLPRGDAILVKDITLGSNAPQSGVTNPRRHSELIAVSAIVPANESLSEFHVAKKLSELRDKWKDPRSPGPDEIEQLLSLEELETPTAVQLSNLRRLRTLVIGKVAYPNKWDVHACDCTFSKSRPSMTPKESLKSQGNEVSSDAKPGSYHPPLNLRKLEQSLAIVAFQRIGELMDLVNISQEQALVLLEARKACSERMKGISTRPVLESVRSRIAEQSKSAAEYATHRLTHILGALVERFGATAGWVYAAAQSPSRSFTAPHTIEGEPPVDGNYEIANAFLKGASLLTVVAAHNASSEYRELEIGANGGIVGHVAATGRGYLSNRVVDAAGKKIDPHYLRGNPSTRSQLSVPLFGKCYDRITNAFEMTFLGVASLESNRDTNFLPIHLADFQAAVVGMIPDMLILRAANGRPRSALWHPEIHGWGLRHILEQFCYAVGTSVPNSSTEPSVGCTVWYADHSKRMLYARGTTHFDYEYLSSREVPFESYVGSILDVPGVVRNESASSLQTLSEYGRKDKASRMEVRREMVTAICASAGRHTASNTMSESAVGEPSHDTSPAIEEMAGGKSRNGSDAFGALSILFYENVNGLDSGTIDKSFTDAVVLRLAKYASDLIQDCVRLRKEVGVATLRARMQDEGLPDVCMFEVMKDTLSDILEADGCTLFITTDEPVSYQLASGVLAKSKNGQKAMYAVATTGLLMHGIKVNLLRRLGYLVTPSPESNSGIGLTRFLINHPGTSIRKVNVLNGQEPVAVSPTRRGKLSSFQDPVGTEVPIPADISFPESLGSPDMGHHRYLGASIGSNTNQGEAIALARLIRRSSGRPFVSSDEDLLSLVMEEICRTGCEFGISFEQLTKLHFGRRNGHDSWWHRLFPLRSVPPWISVRRERTARRLYLPLPVYVGWNRLTVESFLQDLLITFQDSGALLANLRVSVDRRLGKKELRLFAMRSFRSHSPPEENDEYPAVHEQASIGWLAIEEGKPIVFGAKHKLYRRICADSEGVVHGVCIPLKMFVNGVNVDAVLSFDFQLPDPQISTTALAGPSIEKLGPNDSRIRIKWPTEWLEFVVRSCRKLSWISSGNHQDTKQPRWREPYSVTSSEEALSTFVYQLQRITNNNGKLIQVHLLSQPDTGNPYEHSAIFLEIVGNADSSFAPLPDSVSDYHDRLRQQVADPSEQFAQFYRYGAEVREIGQEIHVRFPLYAGFIPAATVEFVHKTANAAAKNANSTEVMNGLHAKVDEITGAWNLFANDANGMLHDWNVSIVAPVEINDAELHLVDVEIARRPAPASSAEQH